MCEGYVEKPLYLLIAEWMMAEKSVGDSKRDLYSFRY
ncbi:transcriptional activator [Escherichia coli]|nr:transcriptional activator [Escherichia coli]